jgi:serpin B
MLILIPQGSQTLDDLARKVDMRLLNKIRTRYKPQNLEIFIPKLHISTMESYSGILKEKLSCCFLPKDADFSGLSKIDRFYLNNFEQVINFELAFSSNSDLDINSETINTDKGEKGSVFIDHPFLFVIYEKYADAVLFIGRIVKP